MEASVNGRTDVFWKKRRRTNKTTSLSYVLPDGGPGAGDGGTRIRGRGSMQPLPETGLQNHVSAGG